VETSSTALKQFDWAGGNGQTARKAKMDRMYLYRLLQRYELRGGSRIDEE
jgi:hypothetical protein